MFFPSAKTGKQPPRAPSEIISASTKMKVEYFAESFLEHNIFELSLKSEFSSFMHFFWSFFQLDLT